MIVCGARFAEPRAEGWHPMGIVEPNQAGAGRIVQRKRIAKTMRPFRCRRCPPDFEFQPIALVEMMNATIERKQEFEGMVQ
jgi:hypothetical protein